jgi:hypothetical protein
MTSSAQQDANGWMPMSALPDPCEMNVLFCDPMLGVIYGYQADKYVEESDEPVGVEWVYRDFCGDYIEGVEPTGWQHLPKRMTP